MPTGETTNDPLAILLRQAIGAQLNIYNGHGEPNDLVGEAIERRTAGVPSRPGPRPDPPGTSWSAATPGTCRFRTPEQQRGGPQAVIVNQTFARQFFPQLSDPAAVVCKRLRFQGSTIVWMNIVGERPSRSHPTTMSIHGCQPSTVRSLASRPR